jgi:serine/threonine protein kinase
LPNVLKRFPEIGLSDDENAIDLLRRMLELDPQHRISPADALQHPFLL